MSTQENQNLSCKRDPAAVSPTRPLLEVGKDKAINEHIKSRKRPSHDDSIQNSEPESVGHVGIISSNTSHGAVHQQPKDVPGPNSVDPIDVDAMGDDDLITLPNSGFVVKRAKGWEFIRGHNANILIRAALHYSRDEDRWEELKDAAILTRRSFKGDLQKRDTRVLGQLLEKVKNDLEVELKILKNCFDRIARPKYKRVFKARIYEPALKRLESITEDIALKDNLLKDLAEL